MYMFFIYFYVYIKIYIYVDKKPQLFAVTVGGSQSNVELSEWTFLIEPKIYYLDLNPRKKLSSFFFMN